MTSDFEFHQSDLNAFFSCPAKYNYARHWRPLEINQALKDGKAAHRMMEGWTLEEAGATARAAVFASVLKSMEDGIGYEVVAREVFQKIPVARGLVLVRTLDVLAYDAVRPIVVDYKTGTWPWSQVGSHVPKAEGWQSKCYLIPDPDLKMRPSSIVYLVATEKGPPQIFQYNKKYGDKQDVLEGARMLRDAVKKGRFPKQIGWTCAKYCDFNHMCFETPGYKELYVPKESNDVEALYGE